MKFGEAYSTKNKRIVYPLSKGKEGKWFCFNQSTGEALYYEAKDLSRNPVHDLRKVSDTYRRLPAIVTKLIAVVKVAQEDYKQRLRNLYENLPTLENDITIKEHEFKVGRIDDLFKEIMVYQGKR